MKTKRAPLLSQSGMTLIEVTLVASILAIMALMLVKSAQAMGRSTNRGNTRALLQLQGQRALQAIIDDLGSASVRTVNAKNFPYVYVGATASYPFEAHTHSLPTMAAIPGDADFGPLQEVVFVLPSDLDGDGRPDMDVDLDGTPELDGNRDGILSENFDDLNGIWFPSQNSIDPITGVVWGHDEYSVVLTTSPDGVNRLERRVNGSEASARVIATHVERIQVDTPDTCQWTIPLNSVRVQLFFRRKDSRGTLFSYRAEVVVALKNL